MIKKNRSSKVIKKMISSKSTKIIGGLTFSSLVLFSCGNEQVEDKVDEKIADNLSGKLLMEQRCNSCHNTQGTDNMLAPPMSRVKDHYWDDETSKKEFVTSIVDWCMNPTEENSMMPGARNKFGLMPKQSFDKKELEAIATYVFETDFDEVGCSH